MLNGILTIYDKTPGSLACHGKLYIKDNTITEIDFSGYPRINGDSWVYFLKKFNRGDTISDKSLDLYLSFNGKYNVVAYFKEGE